MSDLQVYGKLGDDPPEWIGADDLPVAAPSMAARAWVGDPFSGPETPGAWNVNLGPEFNWTLTAYNGGSEDSPYGQFRLLTLNEDGLYTVALGFLINDVSGEATGTDYAFATIYSDVTASGFNANQQAQSPFIGSPNQSVFGVSVSLTFMAEAGDTFILREQSSLGGLDTDKATTNLTVVKH